MATAPPRLHPRKIDSDENGSSEASSWMPDAMPASSSSICAEETSPLSRLELTPFLYGHGTELTPITEQRSIATLRNGIVSTPDLEAATRRKASGLHNTHHHKKSTLENVQESPVSPGRLLRRQQSFSLDSGKTHILQTRQKYQEALHRKETTITSDSSSSSSSSAAGAVVGGHSAIDTACILAEIKSYPHHPPFSPLTQVVTPPEYYEWALSHPIAARNPNHLLQRRGPSGLRPGRGGNGNGGDLSQHPFVLGTACIAPPPITATPPDTTPATAGGFRRRLERWISIASANLEEEVARSRGNDAEPNNSTNTRPRSQSANAHPPPPPLSSSAVMCPRCGQPATEPWKL
ncbi:RNA polymerase II transcription factor B subunit 1 [Apiospora saccharicola]|uniref:RNA polymerase II transcription factor B subunit 1 n=1 Tax=Apiospora saccharicola TaxID=335842 RepID=A0ABR1W4N2_9PEZI